MYKRLPASEKFALIKRIKSGEKLSVVCREAKISRTIVYRWLKEFKNAAPRIKKIVLKAKNPRGKTHWKSLDLKKQKQILKLAIKNPKFSPQIIAKIVSASPHGVWNVLKRNNLGTKEEREQYVYRNGNSFVRERRLTEKRMAIRRFENGEKATNICRDLGISRTIFYRWLKRYKKAGDEALLSLRPREEKHWRFVPGAREFVLEIVISNPEYTPVKISRALVKKAGKKIMGSHGVYNILRRLNLNTYNRRLAYAECQSSVSIPSFEVPDKEVSIFGEIPSISAIPPPSFWRHILSRSKAFFTIFLATAIFSIILLILLKNISSAESIAGKFGIFLSLLSLSIGMFFFIYALKYYLTIAVVLSFSRQGGEEEERKPRSFFSRLFGISIVRENSNVSGNNHKHYFGGGLQPDLSGVLLPRKPFVSIHLATYNEKRVIERLLTAATSMDYENYEVVIVDDSTDETVDLLKRWKDHPRVKVIHRETREGFKGGALQVALENMNPKTEFVLVFDADFIPYPDTIVQFLKYFQSVAGTLDFSKEKMSNVKCQMSNVKLEIGNSQRIAAVQGYQWHVLNKSENWITRGVRSEYAGSYVIERPGTEIYSGLKQIAGSVYMVRADVLKDIGWGASITEDFQLTLKLYEKGYKVVYTPYIQAPAEAVSTIKRLIRQRMRWAEGHSHNIRKMFSRLMFGRWVHVDQTDPQGGKCLISNYSNYSKQAPLRLRSGQANPNDQKLGNFGIGNFLGQLGIRSIRNSSSESGSQMKVWKPSPLTLTEKLEFLYLSPYYLQAFLFMLGTFSWFLAEAVFRVQLPFWTEVWGWSLVLTNLFALPLVNMVGLFLEESEEKDYLGLFSFVALSYIVAPFQAYAALKGFMEKEEGPWFRTPKTGRITDIFTPGRFYRYIFGIFGRPTISPAPQAQFQISNFKFQISNNPYLALSTAHNRFDQFQIRPKRLRWIGRTVVAIVLVFAILLNALSFTQNSSAPLTLDSNKLTLNAKKEFPIEGRDTFAQTETPQFHLKIPDNQPRKTSFFKKFFNNEAQAAEPEIKTSLFDSSGVLVEGVNTKVSKDESGYKLSLVDNAGLKPGKYTLKAKWDSEDGKSYESSQDFRWGVLAINTNKSIYASGEIIKFSFGVLDDRGATICDAQLVLEVSTPKGEKTTLSSQNGLIKQNEKCIPKGATKGADYLGQLRVDQLGSYRLHLVAETQNGARSIDDTVEVKDIKDIPFDIERTDFPSRIYPPSSYPVVITIKASQDFTGTISDQVPASFEITQSNNLAIQQPARNASHSDAGGFSHVSTQGNKKIITWDVNWKRGEVHELGYTIKFPRTSPEFYLVGPLSFRATSGESSGHPRGVTLVFQEGRSWQIAGDVVTTKFMEPGTDATQGFQFYYTTVGSITSQATTYHTLPRAIKFDSGAGDAMAVTTKLATLADAGARISIYYYFDQLPEAAAGDPAIIVVNNANDSISVLFVTINSNGYLKLLDTNATQLGSTGTHQISTGTWYRISFSYKITSTTVNEFRVFVDGVQDISATNATIANTGTDHPYLGWGTAPGANKVGYFDDLYIDDSTALTDTGDIRVTAKLPSADTNIEWDTVTGSGTNNCVDNSAEYGCVDDRPLSSGTTYISDTTRASGTTPKENFAIEGADTGDVAMSQNTVVARTAWVWAERGGTTGTLAVWMWNNGSAVSTTITTTPSLYTNIVDSSTYPTNTQAVGMTAADSTIDTLMYETGMLIAFIGAPVPEAALLALPSIFLIPKIIKSWQQGTLVADFKQLLRRLLKEIQKLLTKSGVTKERTRTSQGRKKKRRKRKVDK